MKTLTEVVDELNNRLRKTNQPYLTLSWADFYALCERERLKQAFSDGIKQEASSRYQLTVAYGQSAVTIVRPDHNLAPAPHWVAARAACQVDTVFEEILKAVQEDVAAMNKLPADQRRNLHYTYERPNNRQANVYAEDASGSIPTHYSFRVPMAVILTKEANGQCIQIQQKITQHGENVDVIPRWNAEKQSCELIWGDETNRPLEVQQVSQKALEPLFFGTDQHREDDEGKRAKVPEGFRKV